MRFSLSCLLVAGVLGVSASAQDATFVLDPALVERTEALRDRALSDPLAYELVASLTTEVGPRLAGSPGDIAAVLWAQRRLQALGFDNVRIEPVRVPYWERGELSVGISSPYPQQLVGTMLGGSVGTGERGVRAAVLRVASLAELQSLDNDAVRGRIVFVDQKMRRAKDGAGYGETVPIRVNGPSLSASKGAVAHVIRSVGTDNHRTGHTGTLSYSADAPKIPALALSAPDADLLGRQLAGADDVILSVQSSARYLQDAVSYNVIGEVTGSDRADEIVLLGAHLDSWDEGTGALDDGAGVAIVTAAAKLIADLPEPPRRTLRVVLFANEEFGLSGANQYLADYADSVDKHVIGMEADLGAGAVWQLSSKVADSALPIIDAIHPLLAPLGVGRGDNTAFGGADIGPLRDAGMPVFGLRQDASRYFDYHHTPGDTLDKIVPVELRQNVAVYATAAYIAASIDADFGRLATP